jgi:glutamate-1-semialdehyde 2,1-aminomutase
MDGRLTAQLARRELAALNQRTRASAEMLRRAERVLPGGVASSFHLREPWPIYLTRGEGARVWDVDGNQYLDFHLGFGSMVQGHAHPAIGAALAERCRQGTHFGAPTEDVVVVAEELARRFGLPRWRFTSSGTESTMAAIRVARGLTGRDAVVRIAGSYHGHHDVALAGASAGIPAATAESVHSVPFNDLDSMERAVRERAPACVILEPALTHGGIVPPAEGYLESVRELTRRHGALLIFDEVKTGLTIAAGGGVERFGVRPDVVTLAKALGGGLPSGAIGMTAEVARVVEDGTVPQLGTFNGSPLGMAAARASLLEVLTPAAYERLEALGERIRAGCAAALADLGVPARAVGLGAKGCVSHDGGHDRELAWLWAMNRGVLMTRGRGHEWTLSVAHGEEDVDRYVELVAELTRRSCGSARA